MLKTFFESKEIKIIYGNVLPIIEVLFLLGIASLNSRDYLLSSKIFDFCIRLFLSFWYWRLFRWLSRIETFSYFPNIQWSKSDLNKYEKIKIFMVIIFSTFGISVITCELIKSFFPNITVLAIPLGFITGLLVFLPLITHYWVLKT